MFAEKRTFQLLITFSWTGVSGAEINLKLTKTKHRIKDQGKHVLFDCLGGFYGAQTQQSSCSTKDVNEVVNCTQK